MNRIFIFFIEFYRKYISPILGYGKCKYTPTCSEYSIEAFRKYSFPKALVLSIWRILRCNPFSKGGYDPLK
ncbi:MAG: membrane protein insertion efficiency factor YidD [Gallicola sp.]|uniref:membrane protein insertion efficiency factor YidD n=1 Tax=Gallicola sp. Sow4_E12 TaxID=3438785 RepID=UPI0017CF1A10|nr:membrane protein insertion efficiency factor YidD [Gallicola sp.]